MTQAQGGDRKSPSRGTRVKLSDIGPVGGQPAIPIGGYLSEHEHKPRWPASGISRVLQRLDGKQGKTLGAVACSLLW